IVVPSGMKSGRQPGRDPEAGAAIARPTLSGAGAKGSVNPPPATATEAGATTAASGWIASTASAGVGSPDENLPGGTGSAFNGGAGHSAPGGRRGQHPLPYRQSPGDRRD